MYVRITKTVNDKGFLIDDTRFKNESEVREIISEDLSKDWYSSLYFYPEEGKKHFETNGSIKGYDGLAYSDKLVFDLDSKDFDKVKTDTRTLLSRLAKTGVDVKNAVRLYFSGNKGFHVYVHLAEVIDNTAMESICKGIAGDLETFDPVIYNVARIFRLPYTLHQSSKLYKVEINPFQLKDLTREKIEALATLPDRPTKPEPVIPVSNLTIFDSYKNAKPAKPVVVDEVIEDGTLRGLATIDFNKCPPKMPRCIYALTHGIMVPGERSRVFFELARYYRNEGMPKDVAYNTLKGVARLNAKLYPDEKPIDKDEIWNQHVASVYSPESAKEQKPGSPGIKADNMLIKKYCDCINHSRPCTIHVKKGSAKDVYAIEDMHNDFSQFATNIEQNIVRTGLTFIDSNMNISRGEVTLVVGSNGSGKTTLSLNLIENANKFGVPAVMFSMDMHRNQLFLKLALKCTNYTKNEVIAAYKDSDKFKLQTIQKAIKDKYPNTFFIFKGTMTFDEMRDTVNELNAQHNIDIGLVLVDYAGRIAGPYSDSYANSNYNALRSKEVADQLNVSLVILSQIARKNGDGVTPLRTSRAAKDSGSWEEAAANVLTVWRPFMGKGPKDDVMRVYLAKNRMGQQVEGLLRWDGASGYVGDMSDDEYAQYDEERLQEEDAVYKSKYK